MKNVFYILIGFLFFVNINYSQSLKKDSLSLDLTKIALANQSDSYVTFPIDIGNIAPLMFEANISPSFIIRERKDARLMGVLTSQIIIRMYNEYSYPVRTPSYMPQISFYYLTGNKKSAKHTTLFGKIGHHSNGQNGDFYNDDGTINLLTGNFATNYFELGFIRTNFSESHNAVKFFKSSLEVHPKSWMLDELHGKYNGFRWHNTFKAFKLPLSSSKADEKPNFSLKVETTWMLDAVNNWDTFDLNRLNASLTFYYHPKFLEDIGFFVQFYHGIDYYNIYFQNQLDIIRFGIMTEILRF
ncbi:hypothetical protein MNBD_BACTEROID04-473 [hydrothermal vent metagenome]|uniref:Uncharacterized protein n=1 Tax=hydrothermal vent metagenome TaxID=652676 RepID=A0A3B0U8H4_9ZZZZ